MKFPHIFIISFLVFIFSYDLGSANGSEWWHEYTVDAHTIALWHFNEGSGSIAYDATPNHNDGTIYEAAWTSGKFSDALNFDGENDYVMITNATSLNPVSQITIEAWAYLDHYPTDEPGHSSELILMKEQEYCLNIRKDGVPYVSICNAGTWEPALAKNPMPLHEWTHLAGTFDKTTKEIKFYVNGSLQETKTLASWNGWNTGHNLYIGCNQDIYNEEYFAGKIDEVRISNIARTYEPAIPTLTEWGLIIFGVVLLGFITWVFLKRRKVIGVRV